SMSVMAIQEGRDNSTRVTVESLAAAKRLPPEFLNELFLHDLPGGGVGIPYYAADGATIAVKRRTALKAGDGSFWPKGQRLAAYGIWRLNHANKAGFLILVEGESDCWALWYHEFPALGLPGSGTARSTLEREHVEAVERVYVHREPDDGGKHFVENVCRRLAELKSAGQVFELRTPEGVKDPADLHAANPGQFPERLQEAIRSARPLPDPGANGHGRPWGGRKAGSGFECTEDGLCYREGP